MDGAGGCVDLLSVAPRAWRICRKIEVSILNWKDEVRQRCCPSTNGIPTGGVRLPFTNPLRWRRASGSVCVFTYDNTESHPRQPEVPPRRFVVGHGETYEEALLMLTLALKDAADLTLLREAHDDLVLQRGDEYRDWWNNFRRRGSGRWSVCFPVISKSLMLVVDQSPKVV